MFYRVLAIVVACLVLPATSATAEEPGSWVDKHRAELVELYRDFHQHPELSFQEKETAAHLARELKAVGAEVTTDFGGYGVVAILANGPGPRIMLRTDLDALPVTEQTGLVYASKVTTKAKDGQDTGIMHACGHDIHITNQIGVARYLAANKDLWSGTVMFIGQPAEEMGGGAKVMLEAGLFTKFPKPDMALALHVDSTLPTGKVGYRAGYSQANVDSVDITIRGRGGHGAQPHLTIDPIVEAARLVLDLQTIVSREIKPQEPTVITVGAIHAGTKHNIIADTCTLQLTVRSYSPEVRKQLLEAIRRKANATALSSGAGADRGILRRHAGGQERRKTRRARGPHISPRVGRRKRHGGRAYDGRRGFQRIRPGRRADFHVPVGLDRSATPSRFQTSGKIRPDVALRLVLPRCRSGPGHGCNRDVERGVGFAAARGWKEIAALLARRLSAVD